MEFRELKISVKNLLNLLNLLRGCKSTSYKQKSLNTLNGFNKTPHLLRFVNLILLRVLRANYLKMNNLSPFNSSTLLRSHFQNLKFAK